MGVTGMQFQRESFDDVIDEIKPLLLQHWKEIASHQDRWQLSPDWDKYALLDKRGHMRIYTAREDGRLIGYAIFLADVHLHYRDMKIAKNDITWLSPCARKGLAGFKLLKFAVAQLDQEVDRIIFNVKVYKDFSKVLERLGFTPFEIVMDRVK